MARKEEWTGGAFDNATSVDVEIDPHRRRLGRSQTDFALQAIVEPKPLGLRSVGTPRISIGPAGYRINRD